MNRLACLAAGLAVVAFVAAAIIAQDVPPPPANPDNLKEVTVTGGGVTKEDALRDALRKAVEAGAGTFISSQSQMKDFALVSDTVLARAAGFVQSKKVLSEKQLPDDTWEIKITAVVSIKGIEDTWGAVTTLLQQMGRPKIMVFVREKIDAEHVEDSTVQTRIEEMLLKSGFQLVNKEQLKEIDKKDLTAAAAEDNPARVQAVAKRFGAQIFISGSANATSGGAKQIYGVTNETYGAEANIKVYQSDTANLIASIPGVSTRGVDRVARTAAKMALDSEAQTIAPVVVAKILESWQEALSGRGEVKLIVDPITFNQYRGLKKALEGIKEIKAVNATFANGVAECSLQAELTAEKLAEKIADGIKGIEISDITQNVIKAKYKPE